VHRISLADDQALMALQQTTLLQFWELWDGFLGSHDELLSSIMSTACQTNVRLVRVDEAFMLNTLSITSQPLASKQ